MTSSVMGFKMSTTPSSYMAIPSLSATPDDLLSEEGRTAVGTRDLRPVVSCRVRLAPSNRARTLRQQAGTGMRLLELKPQPIPARSHVESAVHEGRRRHGAPADRSTALRSRPTSHAST